MELWCKDDGAKKAVTGKKAVVVSQIHAELGLASVAEIRSDGDSVTAKTAAGKMVLGLE